MHITPHVAQNTTARSSAIDDRTTRHAGYAESQKKRKRSKEIFGWLKTVGLMKEDPPSWRASCGMDVHLRGAVYKPGAIPQPGRDTG